MSNIHHFYFNTLRECCHVMWKDGGEAVIVDPGAADSREMFELRDFIIHSGLKPAAILLTHGHFDHIYGVRELQDEFSIPAFISREDEKVIERYKSFPPRFGMPVPDTDFRRSYVSEKESLEIGPFRFEVIETPGHSPGSVCYYDREDGILFTGDTLFAGTIGRTDLVFSDYDKEIVSIMEKLMVLDGDVVIYPGHGTFSDIGRERTTNPFLEPFNEPEESEYEQ